MDTDEINIRIIDHREGILDYQVTKEKEDEIKSFLSQYVEPTELFTKSIEEEIIKVVIGNLTYKISRELWKIIKSELIKRLQNTRKIPE